MRWLPVTAGYGLSTEWSHGNVDELVGAELPIILDRQEDLLNGPSLSVGAFFLGGGGGNCKKRLPLRRPRLRRRT